MVSGSLQLRGLEAREDLGFGGLGGDSMEALLDGAVAI